MVTTPNNEDLSKSLICNPIDGSLFHRWQHVRSWSKESLTKKLEDFNFKPITATNLKDLNLEKVLTEINLFITSNLLN